MEDEKINDIKKILVRKKVTLQQVMFEIDLINSYLKINGLNKGFKNLIDNFGMGKDNSLYKEYMSLEDSLLNLANLL